MVTFRSPSTQSTANYLSTLYSRPVRLEPNAGQTIDAEVASLQLGRTRLTSISYGSPIKLRAEYHNSIAPAGGMMLMLCFNGSGVVEIDNQTLEINNARAVLAQPRHSLSGEYSDDCKRLIIRTPFNLKQRSPRPTTQLDMSTNQLQPWITQIQTILSSRSMMALLAQNKVIALTMEKLLSQLLKSTSLYLHANAHPPTNKIVELAEQYIRAQFDQAIEISDIANELCVPVRTLQHRFQLERCYSPTEYLLQIRLKHAHERLSNPHQESSVTEIAMSCGFNHFSRFAKLYLDRFEESPSFTLRTNKGRLA